MGCCLLWSSCLSFTNLCSLKREESREWICLLIQRILSENCIGWILGFYCLCYCLRVGLLRREGKHERKARWFRTLVCYWKIIWKFLEPRIRHHTWLIQNLFRGESINQSRSRLSDCYLCLYFISSNTNTEGWLHRPPLHESWGKSMHWKNYEMAATHWTWSSFWTNRQWPIHHRISFSEEFCRTRISSTKPLSKSRSNCPRDTHSQVLQCVVLHQSTTRTWEKLTKSVWPCSPQVKHSNQPHRWPTLCEP